MRGRNGSRRDREDGNAQVFALRSQVRGQPLSPINTCSKGFQPSVARVERPELHVCPIMRRQRRTLALGSLLPYWGT